MHVQTISLAAVRSIAKREQFTSSAGTQRMWYVIGNCPGTISHLYGTWPWYMSHGVRDFQRKERERKGLQ